MRVRPVKIRLFEILLAGVIFPTIFAALGQELPKKKFREYIVFHEVSNGVVIDKSTKLLPEDEIFIRVLKKIAQNIHEQERESFKLVLDIIQKTDSSLVVQKAISTLFCFRGIPLDGVKKLHSLAYCDDAGIKSRLPYLFAWFGYKESVFPLIILAGDSDMRVREGAFLSLCYFGVEALAVVPHLEKLNPVGFNQFFFAKLIRHVCYLVFVAGGQQILPMASVVGDPTGNYSNDFRIKLPTLENLIWGKP